MLKATIIPRQRARWLTGLVVTLLAGTACDLPEQDGLVDEPSPDDDAAAPPTIDDPERGSPTHAAIEAALNDYIDAVQDGDDEAVAQILSREMLARLDSDGDGEVDSTEVQVFAESEANKLTASFGERHSDERFTMERIELSSDGATAEAWLAHGGVALPKPQYLVQEDGAWKYGDPARQQARASSTYVVKNATSSNKSVSCSGGSKRTPGGYATVQISCSNVCGAFSGTLFTYNGGQYQCDYNTWGTDFTLYQNYGACTGPC